MIYRLEEEGVHGEVTAVKVWLRGDLVATVPGGLGLVLTSVVAGLRKLRGGDRRADDFVAGYVQGEIAGRLAAQGSVPRAGDPVLREGIKELYLPPPAPRGGT